MQKHTLLKFSAGKADPISVFHKLKTFVSILNLM